MLLRYCDDRVPHSSGDCLVNARRRYPHQNNVALPEDRCSDPRGRLLNDRPPIRALIVRHSDRIPQRVAGYVNCRGWANLPPLARLEIRS